MIASILALTLASLATAAPVAPSASASTSAPAEYVSTYISASDVWTSRFADATYTANATATTTVTVAEVTVTVTPGAESSSTSTWVAPSSSLASSSFSAAASSASSISTWVAPSSSSSTSEWVAPSSSSTSEWVAPSSSAAVVYKAAAILSTSSAAPALATATTTPSNSGEFHGTATYYYQNGNPGSCGQWRSDSEYIVAVNSAQVAGTCGKHVVITNQKNGKQITALCADTCPSCDYGSLDLSSGLFAALGGGDMGQGVFPISWSFA